MRIKIGVVGCGAIAQVHHLPWLTELSDEYQVTGVCDVSKQASKYLADWWKIPNSFTDYKDLINSDVDAVLLCHTDPKTEVALEALRNGKHVFIEKPVAICLEDIEMLLEEERKSGVIVQTGYMKLFEPAFEMALRESKTIKDISLIEIRHVHPNNDLHVGQFRTRKFDDIPNEVKEKRINAMNLSLRSAIGNQTPRISSAYGTMSGSAIHDMYGLRKVMGVPEKVIGTEIWGTGDYCKAINSILAYSNGARAIITWIDLPDLWDFDETLKIYGDSKRLTVSYATGFSKNQSTLLIQEIDSEGVSQRKEPILDWESPFRRELRHFHSVINGNASNRAPLSNAKLDISLNIDIIKSYIDNSEIKVKT